MSNDTQYIYTPTAIQSEFHESSDDYIVLGGSRGSGDLAPLD